MDAPLPRLSYGFARKFGVLLQDEAGIATLIARDSAADDALREARRVARRPLSLKRLSGAEFERVMSDLYASADLDETALSAGSDTEDLSALATDIPLTSDLLDADDDAPVIRLLNGILQEALRARASDIHIEPYENRLAVRMRTDGVLRDVLSLPPHLTPRLVSRVKVMSQLDISRRRIPQDGRFSFTLGDRAVDVRVSTLPSRYGERVVLRILEKSQSLLNLAALGMPETVLSAFEKSLQVPNGIILVTGPTGSGKTTTLYGALATLNDGSRNILTVEDPVEYALDGVGQTQVNAQYDLTFASGLRAILRQDPDIVMVGEIRDAETAEIAIQAALTGHLVLSTVHTNSAIAAIARLRDLGAEPFLLSSTLSAVIAQRLVRRLCGDCGQEYSPPVSELVELGLPKTSKTKFYKAVGCEKCGHTGYNGRLGLFEVIAIDGELKALIHDAAKEADLERAAFKNTLSLLQSGAVAVQNGQTTVTEVLRVCRAGADEA